MPSYLEFYDRGTNDLSSALTLSLGPGDVSATQEYDLWNDKGAAEGADESTGLRLVFEAKSGSTWVRSGLPILDDLWTTVTVVGVDNTGDATFGPYTTGTKAIGAGSEIELPDLPANCAYQINLVVTAPSDITTTSIEFRLVAVDEANSVALTSKLGLLHPGVVPAWRDPAKRQVVDGVRITTDASADVDVTTGLLDYDGTRVCVLTDTLTLNQNDSAAAALGSGESYIATISVSSAGALTATKGTKAASPTAPAVPTGEVFVAYVTVAYEVGGTSVIEDGDVNYAGRVDGDYLCLAGAGLSVNIHGGAGITDTSHYQFHGVITAIALAASDTSYIWRNPDGTFEDTLTTTAPNTGSEIMWEVDTDGSAVTAIRDRRVYVTIPIDAREYVLTESAITASGATILDWTTTLEDSEIDVAYLEAGSSSGGASSAWIVDIHTAPAGEPTSGTWTTIYTSSGTTDLRPTLAYNATSLTASSRYHEVRRVAAGSRIGFSCPQIPAGATLTDVRVIVRTRRYR